MIKILMVLRHMKQKPVILRKMSWRRLSSLPLLTIVVMLVVGASVVPRIRADSLDQQINALQKQNAQNQSAVGQLQQQAVGYQDAISHLQAQIAQLQGQINDNQAKQVSLQAQIIDNQNKL